MTADIQKMLGAVYGQHPKVIYIKVLRRAAFYPPSTKIGRICAVQTKFNEALNDAVAQAKNNIMNVTACMQEDHFDPWGNLPKKGQRDYWQQVNYLLEQFNTDQIQLLLAKKSHKLKQQ